MAKRKPAETFDLKGLKELRRKLAGHAETLACHLRRCPVMPTFPEACTFRDAAQYLTTSLMTIRVIDETLIPVVELRKSSESVPHLDECGLDWNPDVSE